MSPLARQHLLGIRDGALAVLAILALHAVMCEVERWRDRTEACRLDGLKYSYVHRACEPVQH